MSIVISSQTTAFSPDDVMRKLDSSIDHVVQNIKCYCHYPLKDFTRSRIWTPDKIIRFLIQMESKSMKSEVNNFFSGSELLPYDSSLCQQRSKLMPEALERVLYLFTRSFKHEKTLNGYHILAADGSDVNIPYDPADKVNICTNGDKSKEFSQFHLNALYDCLNHVYWDVNIDKARKNREARALKQMIIDHSYPLKSIITADRGYESYDLIACCNENRQKFVFRVKDIDSNGMLSSCGLPDDEFDMKVRRILTRRQTVETKTNRKKYVLLVNHSSFTYLDVTDDYYEMEFRVVRFKLKDGKYECLITNLDEDEFCLEEMKKLYEFRWQLETGFRKIKYTIGLTHFHSRKREYIRQEIFARLILYNLTNIITNSIDARKKGKKHRLVVNYSQAVTNIRSYIRNDIDEEELIKRIKKYLVPIRPDRSYPRKVKPQSVKSFNNRAA